MRDGCQIVGVFLVFYTNNHSRMSFCKGFTQGGSNADNVLTDAFIKGINPVSWSEAFQAIQKVPPFIVLIDAILGRRGGTNRRGS